ncbi:MAG: sigma-70 family RNA polymerase sigma factor, partial [Pseudomonadota bacterium]
AKRPSEEWRPLFFRILKNAIRDHYRRRGSFLKRFSLMSGLRASDDSAEDLTEWQPGRATDQPEVRGQLNAATEEAEAAVRQLPERQREAFLLRSWEGLSVAETAVAMSCSEGSVKTHHSRAIHRLREILGEHWP